MAVLTVCPACSAEYPIGEEQAGKRVYCPNCDEPFTARVKRNEAGDFMAAAAGFSSRLPDSLKAGKPDEDAPAPRGWLAPSLIIASVIVAALAVGGTLWAWKAAPQAQIAPQGVPAPTKKSEVDPEPPDAGHRLPFGRNIQFEIMPNETRRVLVNAEVCLREGQLEMLLTKGNGKTHESLLAADIDARDLHKALVTAGAKEGAVVQWEPNYIAPSGTRVKISLRYEENGRTKTVSARSWLRGVRTREELPTDWVFAGSRLVENPIDPKAAPIFLANDGDIVCVTNFETALLDVPFKSTKSGGDERGGERAFEAWTERIPPLETKVLVIFEPVLPKKR